MICSICHREFTTAKGLVNHEKYHDEVYRAKRIKLMNDPEIKKKISNSVKEAFSRSEVKARHSKATRDALARPDVKAMRKLKDALPEVKQNRSKAIQSSWQNATIREKRIKSQKIAFAKPEVKQKRSKSQKKAWKNSELRDRHSKIIKEVWQCSTVRNRYIIGLNKVETKQKRYETMHKNGTYKKRTNPEVLLESYLTSRGFDVENQKIVHKWPIDFYIKSKNLFIQVDGIYWHGLDRAIETIELKKSKQDIGILRKIETDKEQNLWFKENHLVLVRITDKEIKKGDFSKLENFL